MQILITGVAGLIGSRLADYIIDNTEDKVIGIDDLSGGYIENVNSKVEFYNRDLSEDNISDIFETHDIDVVYHFACYAAEGLSPFMRKFNYQNNILSTVNIINNCINHKIKRLVYASSMSIYGHGKKNGEIFDETLPYAPIDPYAVSKMACEYDIKIAGEQHGLDYVIIRPHNCYSDDTEILTENGWKLFKDLDPSEKVMTLNKETMTMEYNSPTDYQKFFVDDYMYHFCTQGVDMLVTGDHNMITRSSSINKIQKISAEEIYNNPSKYYYYETLKSGYTYDTGIEDDIIIPEVKDSKGRPMTNNHQNGGEKRIKAEDWFSFLGWYISEGSCFKTPSNYIVDISQYETIHSQFCDEIKSLIKRMGFNYYATKTDIKIHSKQLYMFIKSIFGDVKCDKKFIPRDYLNYSRKCLYKLFDSLMKGDGYLDGTGYNTSSIQMANDFCELLLKIGKCGTIRRKSEEFKGTYDVHICKNTNPAFGDNYTKKINCEKVRYSGYVYDLTVPNHIIYVRRNGKCCWGSNCFGMKQNIWDKYRNVLGIWMYQTLNNEPMLIYGDGEQTRAFSYIDNILPCLYRCATDPKVSRETINLGGIKQFTINQACEILQSITGYDKVVHMEQRHEVKFAVPTYQKSIDLLDYKEEISFEEGLKRMWEWAKVQPMRTRKVWDTYEITDKLYKYWKDVKH